MLWLIAAFVVCLLGGYFARWCEERDEARAERDHDDDALSPLR